MTDLIESNEFSSELINFFKDILKPLKIAYATSEDSFLNFVFHISNIDTIKPSTLSVYEIPSLMRVLLTKENILPEEEILKIYPNDEKQICYILEWGKRKSIVIFSLKEATIFADHFFSKDLLNKRETLLLHLQNLKVSNE